MRKSSFAVLVMLILATETFAAGAALDVSCAFLKNASEAQRTELQGFALGYFQGYVQGLFIGSNDKRDLTAKGASTRGAYEFLNEMCARNPEATLRGAIMAYVVAIEADTLTAFYGKSDGGSKK